RLVAGTTEPMLGQMRLAWWREALGQPVTARPKGDAVLDALGAHWAGQESALGTLIDGWEYLLGEPPLARADARGFVQGRASGFAGFARLSGASGDLSAVQDAATAWAIADAAAHFAKDAERATLLELARDLPAPKSLDAPLRGLAVLGALGRRALKRGGKPLMQGRGASLTALRAGLFGR
ncbi:MAG: hypothetical protein AAFR88_05555, partial [Pseudomonadota bacterium]